MKSQERLQSDVVAELAFDPMVDSSAIAVTATGEGVVTLRGTVPEFRQKRAAEKAAKRVAGVKAVANDIEVSLEEAEYAAWSAPGVTDVENLLEIEETVFA